MSIWTRLYQHTDVRGRSTFANLHYGTPPLTYLQIPKPWLKSAKLHGAISSLEIGASGWEHGGRVVLFQHARYRGRYASFGAHPGNIVRTRNLWSEGLNDKTSSVLIIRRYRRELGPLALGNLGSPPLREQISTLVGASRGYAYAGSPSSRGTCGLVSRRARSAFMSGCPSVSTYPTGSTTMPRFGSGSTSILTMPVMRGATLPGTARGSREGSRAEPS